MNKQSDVSITHRVVMGTGWLVAWRIVSRSLGFVSMLILAQLLMPADIGIVALASSITATIDSLSQLGVRDALVRLPDEQFELFNTAFTLQVMRGVLTGLVLATGSLFIGGWLHDQRLNGVLLVLAVTAVLAGFENIGTVKLNRALDFKKQFVMQAAPRVVGFAVTICLAFVLRNYWALIWGTVFSRLISVIATYVISPHRPAFGLKGWRYLLHFSFWTWIGSIAVAVWSRADPFLLGPVLGMAALGIYMLSAEVALLPITELLEPAVTALFPGFAMAQRGGTAPVSIGISVASTIALGMIPFAIGLSACSGYLETGLLGPHWKGSQPMIAILTWLCIFSPYSYVCAAVLSVQGHVKRVAITNALAAAVKVAVVLYLRQFHNLPLLAFAAVGIVGLETSIFIVQLRAAGSAELRRLAMSGTRALIAAVVTSGALFCLPGTWETVTMNRVSALLLGGLIGVLGFALYGGVQLILWYGSGCPEGPEGRGFTLLREMTQKICRRIEYSM